MLRRVLITVVVTLAVIFATGYWIAPIALSFYAARKALPAARVVPTDLKDISVSQALRTKLSYVGYDFEVPWNDLDETQTKLYPADKPAKTVVLTFKSGLRLKVSAIRAHEWTSDPSPEIRMVPLTVAANFGYEATKSDYSLVKAIYGFTPQKMHYWSLEPRVHYREQMLVVIKSVMLPAPAETGIFNIQNQEFKGFQQGDPQVRQAKLEFDLYSDEGSVEFIFFEKDKNSAGVTQPEINRIIQTLRKAAPDAAAAQAIAQR
jgi:hypothetical protein